MHTSARVYVFISDCPLGFDVRHEVIGSCYMLIRDKNWTDSKIFCEQQNSHLVAMETEYEANFLADVISNTWGTGLIFFIFLNLTLTKILTLSLMAHMTHVYIAFKLY